jgi:hypothetical protein
VEADHLQRHFNKDEENVWSWQARNFHEL